jgi:trans-2,3-dihydro-3-hydroxyanthranilate isomerase
MGLAPGDLDPRAPVRMASAGVSLMIVPVRTLAALDRARLDLEAYGPLAAAGWPRLVYLFCPETREPGHDFCARFFFEAHGVREDPAAGNATAFLGAYLLDQPLGDGPGLDLRIEQGHRVGRPSLLRLRARRTGTGREIRVGGQVLPTLRGVLA